MVKWSEFIMSGSHDDAVDASRYILKPSQDVVLNQEYTKRIEEIRALALRIPSDSRENLVSTIQEMYMSYKDTGFLTKEEMLFLNRAYKFLMFEVKYHKDKATTIGRIKEMLGDVT